MKFLAGVKKYLTLIGFGMLAGHIGVGLLGPRALQWYAAPVIPGKPFTCEVEVGWGAAKLFSTQLIAGTLAAVLMIILGVLFGSRGKGRAEQKALGSSPGAAPSGQAADRAKREL
jgi:hypothetical protein